MGWLIEWWNQILNKIWGCVQCDIYVRRAWRLLGTNWTPELASLDLDLTFWHPSYISSMLLLQPQPLISQIHHIIFLLWIIFFFLLQSCQILSELHIAEIMLSPQLLHEMIFHSVLSSLRTLLACFDTKLQLDPKSSKVLRKILQMMSSQDTVKEKILIISTQCFNGKLCFCILKTILGL